jgi:hypothetical protein
VIALGVHVGGDVVRDLTGGVAEADSLVVGCRSDPHGPAVGIDFFRAPKADVMALARIAADGLLKSKILLAPPQVQVADRGIGIRALQHRSHGDSQRAAQTDRIGGMPFGRQHDPDQVGLGADQGDVEGVAGNVVGGVADAGNVLQGRMSVHEASPQPRHEKVGGDQIYQEKAGNDPPYLPPPASAPGRCGSCRIRHRRLRRR